MTAEIPSNEDDSPLVEHYQPQDAGDDDTAKLTTTTIITTSSANPTISFTAGKAPRNISISNNYSNSDDEEYEASTEATIERKVLWPKRPLKSQRRNSSGQAPVILVNTETQTDDNSLAFVHRPECCISIPPPPVQPPPAHLLPRLETATTVNSGGTAAVELESYFYPSPTTCDHQQQALNRIYTTQSPKVISIYNVLLLDILKAVAPPPVDLDSFRAFCRRNGYENHLDFWLVIEYTFKHVKTDDSYIHAIDYILETYLLSPTRTLAKIPLQLTKSTQSDAAKFRKMAKRTGEINTYLFDEMQSKAFEVLSREIFDKFQQYCILNRKIDQSREDALWWKRPILLTEFFSYPNPGNKEEEKYRAGSMERLTLNLFSQRC